MIILGLGCNVGARLENLRTALHYLQNLQKLEVLQVSPVYESDALLPENAPDVWDVPYLNLALRCKTSWRPEELLAAVKNIEQQMGRAEHLRWSPRIIDIDILAWNEECFQTEKLHIPHPQLINRPFAMWPLADLVPAWRFCLSGHKWHGKTAAEIIKPWGSRFSKEAPLHTKQIAHRVDTPYMMGILNVTPDSFSDGGKYFVAEKALQHARELFAAGADIIDIGAESTRPHVPSITPDEEWQRLQTILEAVCGAWKDASFKPKISVDSKNSTTVRKALEFPLDFINDVSGLTDPSMCEVVAQSSAKVIFMHNLGFPTNKNIMEQNLDAVSEVYLWAEKRVANVARYGIEQERLIFDIGIGFGKTAEQSVALIKNINRFHEIGLPILVGHSRKSFMGLFTARPFAERDLETAVISTFLARNKVEYLRVHDVDANMRALKVGFYFENL